MPLTNYFASQTVAPTDPYANSPTPDQMVQTSLSAMLNPNSDYIRNARQRGYEFAQERGGLNSSIAAGAAERSAMEAAMPLVQTSLDMQKTRDILKGQNWLEEQGFNREFQGQLAMMPVVNSFNMLQSLQDYALNDPALYTPDVVSGFSNFFTQNMSDIMGRYFGAQGGS